jgi:hypothetical protein
LLNQTPECACDPHQLDIVDRPDRGVWVRCRDFDVALLMLLNNHVTKQDGTDIAVGFDRSARQRQAAGAEDEVWTEIGRKISLQGMTYVDLGQDLETMAFEGPPCDGNGVLEIHPHGLGEVAHVDLLLMNL